MKLHLRLVNKSLLALISLIFTGIILVALLYTYLEVRLPNVKTLRNVQLQVPLRIYTRNHQLIGEFGTHRRIPVTLAQVPQQLINAILATENARFYEDPGIDIIGLIRATKAVILTGKKVQGASTITMQVARNFFLSPKKTYARKINQILLALKIARDFSKQDILTLYLNKIYLGEGAYGVDAAAQVYYGKPLKQLTLAQMAMIAGLPQAPSAANPIANPVAAKERRNHVLQRMYLNSYISHQQYETNIHAPISAHYHGAYIQLPAPYVAQMVLKYMLAHYGKKTYTAGFQVTTTLSSKLQKAASHALQQGLLAYNTRHGYHPTHIYLGSNPTRWTQTLNQYAPAHGRLPAAVWQTQGQTLRALLASGKIITLSWPSIAAARVQQPNGAYSPAPTLASDIASPGQLIWVMKTSSHHWRLSQLPQVEGAIVALRPKDGALLALSGGFDFQRSHFNRATQAFRQPGSGFKPFVYSAAINKGDTLATLINDDPIVLKDSGENAWWRPHNDNNTFNGPTRLRVGLTQSRNLVSIRLLKSISLNYALHYVQRFGFSAKQLPHGLSLALGSALVTPYQLANAYAMFANGGYHVKAYFINTIRDQQGQIIYQAHPKIACSHCPHAAKRIITPQNAFLITNAMQGVIQSGTGQRAKILHRTDLAGKTGTTNDQKDAWFSGFNSDVETTVWVGYDNMRSTFEYGSQAALPIWIHFMRIALAGKPEASMPEPTGIVTVRIDRNTGLLANPGQQNSMFEYFRTQHVPTQYAPQHTAPHNANFNNTDANVDEKLF